MGGACAVVAIGLIAWLSLDGWFIAGCQERLQSTEFERSSQLRNDDPQLQACLERFGPPAAGAPDSPQ